MKDVRISWVVKRAWNFVHHATTQIQLIKHTGATRKALCVWNKDQFGIIQAKIRARRNKLSAIHLANQGNFFGDFKARWRIVYGKLEHLLEQEELLWKQKAKAN